MECLEAFFKGMIQIGDDFDSIYLEIVGLNVTSSTKVDFQIVEKILGFVCPHSMANERMYCGKSF